MLSKILALSTVLYALVPQSTWAQGIVCTLGPQTGAYNPLLDAPPSAYAAQEAQRIYRLLCPDSCGQVSYVQNPTVPNAATMTQGGGISKIAYSPNFMGMIFQNFGAAASFGVIAHEFGHHVDLNTNVASWMDSSWGREIRADAWAGCALARAGLPNQQLAAALMAIAAYPSPSHPAWNLRLPALQTGYVSCGGERANLDKAKSSASAKNGCTTDKDCKGDRICENNRCQAPSNKKCARDIDCPGDLICDNDSGKCVSP